MIASIRDKVFNHKRLSSKEALYLYENASLDSLQELASWKKQYLHQDKVFYNKNIHFEPTNKCIYSCKFCSFFRPINASEKDGAWDYSLDDLDKVLSSYNEKLLSEIHITGGVHPTRNIDHAIKLLRHIKQKYPYLHIKAFTAVEIFWMCKLSKLSIKEGLSKLKNAGLNSLPGGGAEIFDKEIRKKIAGGKAPTQQWLEIHEQAHQLGIKSNATMLYGHIEDYTHRIDHMDKIRTLQDKTNSFMCFIPLKYRNENNKLSSFEEVSLEEDLRNYAISRLFFDNILHIKAYWVMLGMESSLKSLHYGVDDLDGTIDDSTKIYSMAGSIKKPVMTSNKLQQLIFDEGLIPTERNSTYEVVSA